MSLCIFFFPKLYRQTYPRFRRVARFGIDILVRSIATSHSGSLVNELAGLHVAGTFQSRGSTALTLGPGFVTLHGISSVAQSGSSPVTLQTFKCFFLHRSQALFEGTPGILFRICAPLVLERWDD